MKLAHTILCVIIISLAACESSEPEISDNTLQGYWVQPEYSEAGITFQRASNFDSGAGMAFLANGTLIERANSGWCGTPPISYAEYEGNWVYSDSTITGTSTYWGGTVDFTFRLKELTSQSMSIEIISRDYE